MGHANCGSSKICSTTNIDRFKIITLEDLTQFILIFNKIPHDKTFILEAKNFFKNHSVFSQAAKGLSYANLIVQLIDNEEKQCTLFSVLLNSKYIDFLRCGTNISQLCKDLFNKKYFNVWKLLVKKNFINPKDSEYCIFWALQCGFWDETFFQFCKKTKIPFDKQDDFGRNILHTISCPDDTTETSLFISKLIQMCPKNLHHKDLEGRSPLLFTVSKGDLNMAKILLDNGSCIFDRDCEFNGLMHYTLENCLSFHSMSFFVLLHLIITPSIQPYLQSLFCFKNYKNEKPLIFMAHSPKK